MQKETALLRQPLEVILLRFEPRGGPYRTHTIKVLCSNCATKKTKSDKNLVSGDPAGIRTQDPYIKSVLLYQLSYGILLAVKSTLYL